MYFPPKVGLIVRYDFVWAADAEKGILDGDKDRPCAIMTMSEPSDARSRVIAVAPITHSPIQTDRGETGLEIPTWALGTTSLDQRTSYIKTHEINTLEWRDDYLPYGIKPAFQYQPTFGIINRGIGEEAHKQIVENDKNGSLKKVERGHTNEYLDRLERLEDSSASMTQDERNKSNANER